MDLLANAVVASVVFIMGFLIGMLFISNEDEISKEVEEEKIKEDTYE